MANVVEKLSLKPNCRREYVVFIPEVHQLLLNYCFKNFDKNCKNRYQSIVFWFIFEPLLCKGTMRAILSSS